MFTKRLLRDKCGARLEGSERRRLEAAIGNVETLSARTSIGRAGSQTCKSTLLVEGFISRYCDDRNGVRQLVAVHVPGDFVDLHAFPLKVLDHNIETMTTATVATVPHSELDAIMRELPGMARKLWFATLVDAAIHRAWIFRLGRLDAVGRVAHFLSEANVRLVSAGLSDGFRFAFGITQNDLAEICGLTNVHVNRVMRQLREEKLCVFRSSRVEIFDPARLAARGQFDPAYLYIDTASADPILQPSLCS